MSPLKIINKIFDLHKPSLVYNVLHVGNRVFRLKTFVGRVFSGKKQPGGLGVTHFGSIPADKVFEGDRWERKL